MFFFGERIKKKNAFLIKKKMSTITSEIPSSIADVAVTMGNYSATANKIASYIIGGLSIIGAIVLLIMGFTKTRQISSDSSCSGTSSCIIEGETCENGTCQGPMSSNTSLAWIGLFLVLFGVVVIIIGNRYSHWVHSSRNNAMFAAMAMPYSPYSPYTPYSSLF